MSISRRAVLAAPAAVTVLSALGTGVASATALGTGVPPADAGQSPIDIDRSKVRPRPDLPPLVLSYSRSVDLTVSYISNDGSCSARGPEESVRATVPAGSGTATVGDTVYQLRQFHFHTPAEHTVNGYRFPVEQHFVHTSADGRLLVVGLWLRPGDERAPVDRVLATLPQECGPGITVPGVDLASLVPQRPTVIRYNGSLTTSPFTEGVLWNVLPVPRRVSRGAVTRLRALFPDGDARSLQPLGTREVDLVPGRRG